MSHSHSHQKPGSWESCIEFHGHSCPFLAAGYRAGIEAVKALKLTFNHDEKIACIAENASCGLDALQMTLGCTTGKGNMIVEERGKQAFTIVNVMTEQAVRYLLKPKYHITWEDQSDWEEKEKAILNNPAETIFDIRMMEGVSVAIPDIARLLTTVQCEVCGECVCEHMLHVQRGKKVCPACFEPYEKKNDSWSESMIKYL